MLAGRSSGIAQKKVIMELSIASERRIEKDVSVPALLEDLQVAIEMAASKMQLTARSLAPGLFDK